MRENYLQELLTPAVAQAQERAYGRAMRPFRGGEGVPFGADERTFVGERDSFYLASKSESGWPYLQHRGGPPGFVRFLESGELAFGDFNGNRQLLSAGNLIHDDRVSLFFMHYPARERLKIIGHARVVWPDAFTEELKALPVPTGARLERAFVVRIVGFDWNCPKYITPRFSTEEVLNAVQPLRTRIAELEAELAHLRTQVS